ncbi:hypothetical protein BDV33DRAFT_201430 [Aspergillus novoparasiticus]|uniref:Uncharacterized protein n=1 Tax=Aspergillus novoparasiticus TaxID=986946 RepID=A0A5N6F0V1_9EURO|nr:hypothetical protein BDV33DRAFT_201430 [Aspergillus novoparasiticus]
MLNSQGSLFRFRNIRSQRQLFAKLPQLPRQFFRCQHDGSFTSFGPREGFESGGHCDTSLSYWLNRGNILGHIDWDSRPWNRCLLFLSLITRVNDVYTLAGHHQDLRHSGIIVAKINTSTLKRAFLQINFEDRTVQLPVWTNDERATFISTDALREHLEVPEWIGQRSEWFALDYIPASMIERAVQVVILIPVAYRGY